MPEAWSAKDERQYEHIKDSAQDRGASTDRAEEIAARTVNKHRREEGRTRSGRKTTSGTGNPRTTLDDAAVVELRNIAADRGIRGRSKMKKDELISALRKAS
jgi:plasmid stabilization system protein ParE